MDVLLSCTDIVASTHDQHVFSFYPDNRPCNGFEEVLARYREIVPYLKLSGFRLCTAFSCIIIVIIFLLHASDGILFILFCIVKFHPV